MILISAMLTNDSSVWPGESFLICSDHALKMLYKTIKAHSSRINSKGYYIPFVLQNPSGIVYTVLWSSSVAIVLGLYTCNLPAWLLAWEEQTGQDSMSPHHLKILAHIKQSWREGTTLPYTLIHFSTLLMFLPHLHSHLTLMYRNCTVLTSSSPT